MLEEGARLGVPLPSSLPARRRPYGDEDLAAVITTLEHLPGMGS